MVLTKEWFTVEEAAEYLCVSKRTIYKLTKEGRLEAFRIGLERHRRFLKKDLDNLPKSLGTHKDMDLTMTLTELTDPVLADLWDNKKDEAYDRLQAG